MWKNASFLALKANTLHSRKTRVADLLKWQSLLSWLVWLPQSKGWALTHLLPHFMAKATTAPISWPTPKEFSKVLFTPSTIPDSDKIQKMKSGFPTDCLEWQKEMRALREVANVFFFLPCCKTVFWGAVVFIEPV